MRNEIAIYSRKSKFTGKGESIENQIELCRQYILAHYPNTKPDDILVYEDEGFSGGNIERPKFKLLMSDAKEKKFFAIVCYRLDRISRNIGDFAKLIEELNELQVAFISIKEQFDTASPMGRAMMYIASVFSQLERETIAERIRDNMHELSKTGRWLGGITPTGYKSEAVENITIDGKSKKSCKLRLLPQEADLIRVIFERFIETNSLTKTETYLIQNNYKTKNGKLFTRFAIKNILRNPVYMIADSEAYKYLNENEVNLFSVEAEFDGQHGIMAYNRTLQKASRATQIREMNEWIASVGKHQGIIEGADWIKVQQQLQQNRSKDYRKPQSNTALLAGLLYCDNCNNRMRPKLSKRINKQGEQIYTYLCTLKEKSCQHNCEMKNVNGNILDRKVCEEIMKLSEDSSEFIYQLEKSKNDFLGNKDEYEGNIERLKSLLQETEKEIEGLVNSVAKAAGSTAEEYIIKQIEERHDKAEVYRHQIKELKELTSTHSLSDVEFDVLRQMLVSFKDIFESMTIEQKRLALRTFIKKVVWDGKNVYVYLFGTNDNGSEIDLPDAQTETLCENSK